MSLSRKAFYQIVRSEPVLSSKLLWSFVQVLSRRLRATNEALSDARSETAGPALPPFAEIDDLRREATKLGTAEAGSLEPTEIPESSSRGAENAPTGWGVGGPDEPTVGEESFSDRKNPRDV